MLLFLCSAFLHVDATGDVKAQSWSLSARMYPVQTFTAGTIGATMRGALRHRTDYLLQFSSTCDVFASEPAMVSKGTPLGAGQTLLSLWWRHPCST